MKKDVWRKSPSNAVSALFSPARKQRYGIREDVMEYLTKEVR